MSRKARQGPPGPSSTTISAGASPATMTQNRQLGSRVSGKGRRSAGSSLTRTSSPTVVGYVEMN
jgi:hypothetical protein